MSEENIVSSVPTTDSKDFDRYEVMMAGRNRSILSELLDLDVTPIDSHYQLVHFDVPVVDPDEWALSLTGLFENPLVLSLDDIKAMNCVERHITLECAGNGRTLAQPRLISQPWETGGVSTAVWTGVRLSDVLEKAKLKSSAKYVVFHGLDSGLGEGIWHNYARRMSMSELEAIDPILAWGMNGAPLPPVHGFPMRVVCPGYYGMASVKWLSSIAAVDGPGFLPQNDIYYRIQLEDGSPGEPVTTMLPRSLIKPFGVPDESRNRYSAPGHFRLTGRAWSGFGEIVKVEVTIDGGNSWDEADLSKPINKSSWQKFSFECNLESGKHKIGSRATDESGRRQPFDANWNVQGLANNMISFFELNVDDSFFKDRIFPEV